jgi:hypothetical protein
MQYLDALHRRFFGSSLSPEKDATNEVPEDGTESNPA